MPQAAQPISDREILADILLSQKQMTDLYNLSAGKCSAGTLQSDMLDILREEHNIRAKVYEEMEKRGFVNPAPAGQAEIDAVRAGFSDAESNF